MDNEHLLTAKQIENGLHDRHRPGFHFLPAKNWMNDPNGLIQWKGQYHLFYQYNPNAPIHENIHWGHAVSHDLVHWQHLPIALTPTPGSPDAGGCWSGCAVVQNGVPTIVYTGYADGTQLPCLATGDDDLINWKKYEHNPIITAPPADLEVLGFRDHSIWREDEWWYQAIGSGLWGKGGAILLYRSRNLRNWEYLHPLLAAEELGFSLPTGQIWECPSFFPLGDRYVLVISLWDQRRLTGSARLIGAYRDHHFIPSKLEKLDYGDGSYYAPQTMLDDRGRRLIWGWIQEGRSPSAQIAVGWSGAMSLPRVLALDQDGRLKATFANELIALRRVHHHFENIDVEPNCTNELANIQGDQLEIIVELERTNCAESGLLVFRSPNGDEETVIAIDWAQNELVLRRDKSSADWSTDHTTKFGHLPTPPHERVKLHIFLDHSVIEIIANEETMLTSRVYPTKPDSQGLALYSLGGKAKIKSLDVWQLDSIWQEASGLDHDCGF